MDHQKRYERFLKLTQELQMECEYLKKLNEILSKRSSKLTNKEPVEFLDYLFCGSRLEATDFEILRKYRITHVLNCAPIEKKSTEDISCEQIKEEKPTKISSLYSSSSNKLNTRDIFVTRNSNDAKIKANFDSSSNKNCETLIRGYLEIKCKDDDQFPILRKSYNEAKIFIDKVRDQGGRVLVHCEMGINRSISICSAYTMDTAKIPLFKLVRIIKLDRPSILTNDGFKKQLIEFAIEKD